MANDDKPQALVTVRTVDELRALAACWRAEGQRIALVPTMGALHDGHLSLIATARQHADRVVASIFVNPTQFGPNEDFDRYPRQEAADQAMLAEAGCDMLYAPDAPEMYRPGFGTSISAGPIATILCGMSRPGHFDGVATVVTKLFNQARPGTAVFGEKDFQQLAIIRRVVKDLDLEVEIVGSPIIRDPDGLALSSRNRYLTADERAAAPELNRSLVAAAAAIRSGAPVTDALSAARKRLEASGFGPVDYVSLREAATLDPVAAVTADSPELRLLAAATLGRTRLIDNIPVPLAS